MWRDSGTVDFGQFDRKVLPDQICSRFLSLIEEGRLGPGDKLPPERDLAAQMGVSRPSLREALRALSAMRVIEMRHGDGTYITSLEPALLVQHLDFVFALDDSTFFQLLQARKILEPGIAALVALLITEKDLAKMNACLAKSAECLDDPEAFLQADLELHQRIVAVLQNPILNRLMAVLSHLGVASRRRTVVLPGVAEQTALDHKKIVQALLSGDPAGAQEAMLHHLQHVEHQLAKTSASARRDQPLVAQESIAIPERGRGGSREDVPGRTSTPRHYGRLAQRGEASSDIGETS